MEHVTVGRDVRHARRVRSRGAVQLHDPELNGRIVDVAIDSIAIRTRSAPPNRTGRLTVRFDLRPGTTFDITGHVVRRTRRTIVIALDAAPADYVDYVARELEAAGRAEDTPSVVLIDEPSPARDAIAAAFRGHGCRVVEVSTPLEALYRLEEARFEPAIIAISDGVPESEVEDLRDFLSLTHPDAHMVAIGKSARGRDPESSWLSDRAPELETRVGRLVTAHGSRTRSRPSPARCCPWKLRDN